MLMRWNVDLDALTLPVNNVLVWRYLNRAASWLVNISMFGGFTPYDLPNFLGVAEGIQDSPFWFWVLRRCICLAMKHMFWMTTPNRQLLMVNSHNGGKKDVLKGPRICLSQNMYALYILLVFSQFLACLSASKSKCFFHGFFPALVPRPSPWVLLAACYGSCRKVRGVGGEKSRENHLRIGGLLGKSSRI